MNCTTIRAAMDTGGVDVGCNTHWKATVKPQWPPRESAPPSLSVISWSHRG